MQTEFYIFIGVAMLMVMAFKQGPSRAKPLWLQQLKGSQKVFGPIAFVGVLLLMIHPEFLALGLLGDMAFFEMLVLALTLQIHLFVVRSWLRCVAVVTKGARFLGVPSPGFRYVMALTVCSVSDVASFLQKAFNRVVRHRQLTMA